MEARKKQLKRKRKHVIYLKQNIGKLFKVGWDWSTTPNDDKGSTNTCTFPGVFACMGSDDGLPKLE